MFDFKCTATKTPEKSEEKGSWQIEGTPTQNKQKAMIMGSYFTSTNFKG
jgi:hypothetical protein